jgi:hypothetical protein
MNFAVFESASVPQRIATAAAPVAKRYGVEFGKYYVVPGSEIRMAPHPQTEITNRFRFKVASDTDSAVLKNIAILTEVANTLNPAVEERDRYLRTMLAIYDQLGIGPKCEVSRPDLLVAPKREGATLAKLIGLDRLVPSAFFPEAKRIQSNDDLIVGLTFEGEPTRAEHCLIVDGAIGSGATLFAIMHHLRCAVRSFTVYSVHATMQGLAVLCQFAGLFDISIEIQVGHVSGQLNEHYYATEPCPAGRRLVVGDVGDTIVRHID